MKTKALSLLLAITFTSPIFAQQRDRVNDRIEAMRAQFFTEKLDLTPEEAQKFWPVYNQYREELAKIQGNRMKELTDHKSDRSIEDMSA
ncbi:MAG: hypothetical protein ACPF9D_13825, partial [Owenweeksia sp.]